MAIMLCREMLDSDTTSNPRPSDSDSDKFFKQEILNEGNVFKFVCLFACPRVGGNSNMIITYKALDLTVKEPNTPSPTYSNFPTKCRGDDISSSLPYANEVVGRQGFQLCVSVYLSTRRGSHLTFTHDARTPPPGHVQTCSTWTSLYRTPSSWPDIWWIQKHLGLASAWYAS